MAVTACQTRPPPQPAQADPAFALLAESASRVSSAFRQLADIEAARTPSAGDPTVGEAYSAEFQQLISVTWAGPVEPLLEEVAARVGYTFGGIGDRPASDLVVRVDAHDTQIGDLLRDIWVQFGGRADLIVDEVKRRIEVRYARR
ncbi:DotD/TraH family lipoprotein [Niveispirillum sp. SYP-B3756]|uniref:DotD/TraH family lipoprotein n=1 Tax=Niveispirillum sp. SYP-B3756 TaxID=2662178 RepID=UPI001FFE4508|nr:DotD/TraH family lipoprotein [Niveispirillum sp. SYP-B3756]